MSEAEIASQHSGVAYIVTQRTLGTDGVIHEEGDVVWPYAGYTYGAIGHEGVALTMEPGKGPFFELPRRAVRMVGVD